MLEEEAYWCANLEEDYQSLAPHLETSVSRCSQIKAYGMLVILSICHGISPDPVSPFLLTALLDNDELLYNLDFIKTVAPITGSKLQDWPTGKQPPVTICRRSH